MHGTVQLRTVQYNLFIVQRSRWDGRIWAIHYGKLPRFLRPRILNCRVRWFIALIWLQIHHFVLIQLGHVFSCWEGRGGPRLCKYGDVQHLVGVKTEYLFMWFLSGLSGGVTPPLIMAMMRCRTGARRHLAVTNPNIPQGGHAISRWPLVGGHSFPEQWDIFQPLKCGYFSRALYRKLDVGNGLERL